MLGDVGPDLLAGQGAGGEALEVFRGAKRALRQELATERAKAVTRGINERCRNLRPYAELLVDGFGIPEQLRYAEMLHPENIVDT